MRQDEDAELARRLDEAGGGDGFPGRRGVAETVPPNGARVGTRVLLELPVLDVAGVVVVLGLFLELDLGSARAVPGGMPVAVPVLVGGALRRGDQLGEHPGEGVDLVTAKLRPRGCSSRILGQHAFQAEHEAVAHLPSCRRRA